MWAGVAGFVWHLPEYKRDCQYLTHEKESESVLRARGLEPMKLLTTARLLMVFGTTISLALAFVFARRLSGIVPACGGFLLIAFDPFHIAHSRFLHLDGLLSSLVLLAMLAFMSYLRKRRLCDLIVSGVAAGLGWLTKSPSLFLVPFVGLLSFVELWRIARSTGSAFAANTIWRLVWPLIVWGVVGAVVFAALWPAMWVDPIGTLTAVLGLAADYASGGHGGPVFFDGILVSDGRLGVSFFYFYPLSYLWRSTPVVLIGLLATAMALFWRRKQSIPTEAQYAVWGVVLFVTLFTAAISVSQKKFDRYLLPVYAPLDLVAAMGWVAIARWLGENRFGFLRRYGASLALCVAVVVQATSTLQTFPYYLTHYNLLMGGSRQAPNVMMIGWGEGLDQAARYLNEKPDARELHVFSWYRTGSFSYTFTGASRDIPRSDLRTEMDVKRLLNSDYAVTYHIHQQQREPSSPLLSCLAQLRREHTIWINGLEYARIYKVRPDPPSDPWYVQVDAQLGEQILLEGYVLPRGEFAPGNIVPVWLSWWAVDTPSEQLRVFVHVLNEAGGLVAQSDAEPVYWARPTNTWKPAEQIIDGHGLYLPSDLSPGEYSLVTGMYRHSGERLTITQAGQPVGDALVLGQISVTSR
jgi:4-amino-4-deoxy-L-arabinose transferase-like glycosyltransferase